MLKNQEGRGVCVLGGGHGSEYYQIRETVKSQKDIELGWTDGRMEEGRKRQAGM